MTGFEGLTQLEIILGFAGLVSLSISIIIGIKIISKYFTIKKVELLTVGLTIIFITSGWWSSALAFIMYIFFNSEVSDVFYIFISYGFVSLSSIFWIFSFGYLVYPKSKWKLLSIWLVISIVYTIFFMYYLYANPSFLGVRITRFDSEMRNFVSGYGLLSLLISLITNCIFFWKCLQIEDLISKWKGLFIFLGVIVFLIGAILDSVIALDAVMLFTARILLLFSSTLSYIGWIMPERVANRLVKGNEKC